MIDLGEGVQLVTRAEWGAARPRHVTPLTPSYGTTTHWEGPHMGQFPHTACYTKVRGIQAFHMGPQRGWSDIAYTAVTCPHGYVFQGRWVAVRTAANGTNDGNNRAYAVCYLGGQGDDFTDAAKHAQRVVLDWLDRNGSAGGGRNCHRDWKQTECPGDRICGWVKAGQPDPSTHPDPPPPLPEDDDVPHFHTVRRSGKSVLLVTSTGLRAEFAPNDTAGLQALSKKLEAAGFDHAKTVECDSDSQYAVLTAPAPLTDADLLRVADTVRAGFNVTKPATPMRPNPGVFVADLAKIVADNCGGGAAP